MVNRLLVLLVLVALRGNAQRVLSLKEAISIGTENYGTVKAKSNYASASRELAQQAQRDYLPNVNIQAQQDYGSVNGQNGPLYGFGGLGVSSSGLPLPNQNWNAAFGALYLTNVNWDFFAFGRAKEKIKTAQAAAARDQDDYQQEIFRHKVRVTGAYLDLLAAVQLSKSLQNNLLRASSFRESARQRAIHGLVAGVDSSLANAEYSAARLAWIHARDIEQERNSSLIQLLGITPETIVPDSAFATQLPVFSTDSVLIDNHPVLAYYRSRINYSEEQRKYYKTLNFPAFTMVGIYQARASGFNSNYAQDQSSFNSNYSAGVVPSRSNYLVGVGVTWNIIQPLRISQQVKAQKFVSQGLQNEYELANQQLLSQLNLSEERIKNALEAYREAPIQVKAANDAYVQRTTLYKNGLTTLVDVTQSLYAYTRAETERDIAYNNVWQALLLKAAAAGDFNLFESQLR